MHRSAPEANLDVYGRGHGKGRGMRMLVHACCAGCFARTLAGLADTAWAGASVTGYWDNPNIHPLIEYRRRLKAMRMLAERIDVPVMFDDSYGLEAWCRRIHPEYGAPGRCERCYGMRLGQTATYAAANGFDAIATTLMTSRHQDHARIAAAGAEAAHGAGVGWVYADLREAEAEASLLQGLYRQAYCGCVFSERDRYAPTTKHLYHASGSGGEGGRHGHGHEPV